MSATEAVETLRTRPQCTDIAVAALERSVRDLPLPSAWSDLSAAYYVRAQREDEPSDFLRALDAAQRALNRAPLLPEAQFNRALAQEALGLSREAMRSWDALRRADASPWAREANEHWQRLARASVLIAATQWSLNRGRLPGVVQDTEAVAKLIAPYPAAAQRYVEDELLPRWADAAATNDVRGAQDQLALATAVAAALARETHDRYLLDVVNRVAEPGAHLADIREGHSVFGKARAAERDLSPAQAAPLYAQALRLLEHARSPLRLGAQIGLAIAVSFENNQLDRAVAMLAPIEAEGGRRGYTDIVGRAHATRGFFRMFQSRYLESLAEYDAAMAEFASIHDQEGIANAHTRRSGVLRALGQAELAWRESFQAQRNAAFVVEISDRHHLLGEVAATALALEHPQIAATVQRSVIAMLQYALSRTPQENTGEIRRLRMNLSIALRSNAVIELNLDQIKAAEKDLADSIRLAEEANPKAKGNASNQGIRRAVLARLREVEGEAALRSGPDVERAIRAFNEALNLAGGEEYRTFRAMLLTERADANRAAKRSAAEESDLKAALDELHAEETDLLAHRRRGTAEAVWTSYFARFRKTYDRLILRTVEQGQTLEAFGYAERARAFEPLDLVMHLDFAPKEFRSLVHAGDTMQLPAIQQAIPPGTYLIEYYVLDDRTLVWIVSHQGTPRFLDLPVPGAKIAEWSATLQLEARHGSDAGFQQALVAPSAALVAPPLAVIDAENKNDGERRLVFVPDRGIHGLPLAALRDSNGRYIVQRSPVAVAGSATLYVFSLLRDLAFNGVTPHRVLLVGNPDFDKRIELTRGLDPLRFAKEETDEIHKIYAPISKDLGEHDATVPHFLELAKDSAVIHVAGHAIANARAPFRSSLLLAPSPGETGALEAEELLARLHVDQTRLVVLSACSTAGGLPIGPEGLSPLVRPLIGAGVPAVVGSLWNIGDAGSKELLVRFHQNYRSGLDAAAALQMAQRDLIGSANPGLSSALTWAPFEVVGYAASSFRSKQSH